MCISGPAGARTLPTALNVDQNNALQDWAKRPVVRHSDRATAVRLTIGFVGLLWRNVFRVNLRTDELASYRHLRMQSVLA